MGNGVMIQIDWGTVDAFLLIGVLGFLWHQSRRIDGLWQIVMGVAGEGGLLKGAGEVQKKMERLISTMGELTFRTERLTAEVEYLSSRINKGEKGDSAAASTAA